MTDKWVFNTRVAYGDVDRREVMSLPRLFKLLQEVAIAHANQFGTGSHAAAATAETWVLNRIAAAIARYPAFDEALRVETWSKGVRGFRGYRDFRVYDGREQLLVQGSSLWLYVNTATNAIVRAPADIVARFPVCAEPAWCPELEKQDFSPPNKEAPAVGVTLRYSDFDVNEHVNNAAYFDLLQTGLERSGCGAHPKEVRVKFARAISLATRSVDVRVEPAAPRARFSIEDAAGVFALGEVLT